MILPRMIVLGCLVLSTSTVIAEPAAESTAKPLTYRNPILTEGSPADPHVIRVDGTYYLYATTHGRGFDVLTSTDLVNWEPKGRAFDDPRGGAWAPDVFHNVRGDGKFYLYYTDNDSKESTGPFDKQIGVAVADSPLGPFVDKGPLVGGVIDAHLFQDDDGRYYLYYVSITDGFKIIVQPMADPLTPKGEPTEILHPTEPWEMAAGEVTEGPFILKRDGVYYLMYSGSGADSPQYAIGYATAKAPVGPFEKFAGNPIVQQREGLYGPGHHAVIEGPDGKLWMVYHQKYSDRTSYRRFVAIDPLWFDDAGVIHAKVTRETNEAGPVPKAAAQ
jgi:xylan 1,4-beta-xylosidase